MKRLILSSILACFLIAIFTVPALANSLPYGALDVASPTQIAGWAYDLDRGAADINVHIYVNGVLKTSAIANQYRPDVDSALHIGAYHGYSFSPYSRGFSIGPGDKVDVYAINLPLDGRNPLIGSKTLPNNLPRGFVDIVSNKRLEGWAYDPDYPSNAINVHIYRDGVFYASVLTSKYRSDVNSAFSIIGNHGFALTSFNFGNCRSFNFYAINLPTGINPFIGGGLTGGCTTL